MPRSTASAFVRDQFTWLSYAMLAYYGYYQASLGPLMPFLRAELGLSYTAAGFHFSAFALGMIFAGMAGNRLAGRWGRYRIFWSGAIGMAVGVGVMMLGQRISLTVTAAFIMGMLGTLMLVMIQAALSDRHGRRRTVALTEANVAASLSGTLVPLFIGTFQRLGWGWRSALIIPIFALVVIGLRNRALSIPDQRENLDHANRDNPLPPRFWAFGEN